MKLHTKQNIILCGLPGSGKSTIGKKLASLLQREFVDSDDIIEQRSGMSCREYYQTHGEEAFRKLEKEAILSLKDLSSTVIALGGGSVEIDNALDIIPALGFIILINEGIDTLIHRKVLQDNPATVSDKKSYKELASKRLPSLKQIANIEIISANKPIDKLLEEIAIGIRRYYGE